MADLPYTWSNGMNGSTINVYSGGPYKVYFHDGSGCVTTAETDVPRDPQLYLWVFPEGCYKLCQELMDQGHYVLNGPVIPFDYWEWLNDYYSENGFGFVDPYVVTVDGPHTLTLDNGLCSKTSGAMNVEAHDCNCELEAAIEHIWVEWDDDGNCWVYANVVINNPYAYSVSVTLSSPDGDWTPNTLIVPPGGSVHTVRFLPNAGFTGGSTMMQLYAQIVTADGIFPCYWEFEIGFPRICDSWKQGVLSPEESQGPSEPGAVTDAISLRLAPNPATEQTRVHYAYGRAEVMNRSIEVYDLTGRKIRSFAVPDAEGILELDMSMYSGGVYIVVMKADGAVLQHQKLTLTR